jgi:hypothetical protein
MRVLMFAKRFARDSPLEQAGFELAVPPLMASPVSAP